MVFNRDSKKESIFRQESLERLSSPERLDQLMQVLAPKDWLALTVFGGLTAIGLVWSILGRIPIAIEGRAIFLQPRQVVDLQSSIGGRIQSLKVTGGQCVKKDELLATINPLEMQKQLQLAKEKLLQLQKQTGETSLVSKQRMELEKIAIAVSQESLQRRLQDAQAMTPILKERGLNAIAKQKLSLQQRLQEAQSFAPTLKEKGLTAIQQQRLSLQQRLKDARALVPVLEQRLKKRRELAVNGAISTDTVLQVEKEYNQGVQDIAELEAQLKQLDLTEAQTQQSYQQNVNNIGELQAQLQELELQSVRTEREYLDNLRSINEIQAQLQELNTKYKRLEQENLEISNRRIQEIQEVGREVIILEQRVTENSQILSSQDGCILELTAAVGQVIQPGSRLGNMRIGSEQKLGLAIAYFSIKDGKQIQPGMPVLITPDTVQRERFGGIVGQVTEVSPLAVTAEGTVATIGNSEVVKSLISQTGAAIQVTANLQTEDRNPTGYKWSSSKGPNSKITPGTTATVRVTVDERSPITFLLPFLREILGTK
ncbi:NHLP bacteriocin system secretion protein [Aerosakkonema funiforme]|uniref:NHLP bacteriocin system secretion protein n=1 Tax=Aerosakkonema funiforme FACHB-1375 TaxID=2949571 RepID=A0A926ZH34_9CYAN|nr:NHLP bacteriocin system secretion protein [Aerosakkonema funiforme]MBD2182214.1 NHLP bacteriocin system secretion protein [Aerosakkonema funiforme FACHB-1375]